MVFPQSLKASPRAEQRFLQRLRALLPAGVRPILVTDAGFRAPWLRRAPRFGWSYVGRLHGQIDDQARRLEDVRLVQHEPWWTDLVLYRQPARGRRRLTYRGTRRRA